MCKFKSKKKLINDGFEKTVETKKEVEVKQVVQTEIRANVLWGKVVFKLRQLELVSLHTACGEIRDVKIVGNELTVFVKEEYLYNVLTREENFNNIKKVLKLIDNALELKIEKLEPEKNIVEENKKRLLKLFDDKVKIVD